VSNVDPVFNSPHQATVRFETTLEPSVSGGLEIGSGVFTLATRLYPERKGF